MINSSQQKQTDTHAHKEWAEAYVDLQEDELMQHCVVSLQSNEADRRLGMKIN